jgi:predicted choloylglycine hydrolase
MRLDQFAIILFMVGAIAFNVLQIITNHDLKNKVESLQYLSADQYRVNQELVDIIDSIVILEENNNERLSSLEKQKGATHVKENWKIIRGNYFGDPTPRINRCILDKTSPTKQRCSIVY